MDIDNLTEAQQQAYNLFLRFKELHPNSSEEFVISFENLNRWAYHVQHAETLPVGVNVDFTPNESDAALIASRAVNDWNDFDIATKQAYDNLQSSMPRVQLWATGSRVDGTYIDGDSHPNIAAMRKRIGKQDKSVSDFDITAAEISVIQFKGYFYNIECNPENAKREIEIHNKRFDFTPWHNDNDIQPKIKIPMWDFSKLPESERQNVIDLYNENQWGQLIEIHDRYGLSPNNYCCDVEPVKRWYKYAIEQWNA